eukprot:1932617-Rhodomonas_salina.1
MTDLGKGGISAVWWYCYAETGTDPGYGGTRHYGFVAPDQRTTLLGWYGLCYGPTRILCNVRVCCYLVASYALPPMRVLGDVRCCHSTGCYRPTDILCEVRYGHSIAYAATLLLSGSTCVLKARDVTHGVRGTVWAAADRVSF